MIETVTATVGAGFFMALALERLVELFIKPAVPAQYKVIVPYAALVLGVLAAFGFNIDLITPTLEGFGIEPAVSWAGLLVSGLLIGGGSNLLHDLWPGKA